jgi:hypothetical protein
MLINDINSVKTVEADNSLVVQWFSSVTLTNKTDRHDITETLLKVALNTITPNPLNGICGQVEI